MKTKAAVLVKLHSPLELMDLDLPELKSGQVLVKVAYSGLCHSQLNEIQGLKGEDRFIPHALGHEGSGIVEAIGSGVKKVKPGDKVVLTWIKGEGADVPSCQYGPVNSGAISTFLTRAVISENRVVPIPVEMPLREAALLGCAVPTGAGVVKNEMNLKEGNSFAVFGAGGIGLSALLAAKGMGAYPLIAVDVNENKLSHARACGATHAIHALKQNPVEAILDFTKGIGVDYVFESAGQQKAMEQAFSALKAPGGLCVLAGNLPIGQRISIDPFDLIRGKRIVGTWGGKSQIDRDIKEYVGMSLNGEWDLSQLITHEVPLDKINDLILMLEGGEIARGLIRCS